MSSNKLKELREKVRLTQTEVAKLLDVHFSTVAKHENGDRGLTGTEIDKYAKLYKVQPHEIFTK